MRALFTCSLGVGHPHRLVPIARACLSASLRQDLRRQTSIHPVCKLAEHQGGQHAVHAPSDVGGTIGGKGGQPLGNTLLG